jgi:hypothetical protein
MVLTAIKTEFSNQFEVHKKSAIVSVSSQQKKNPTITVAEGKKPVVVPTEFATNHHGRRITSESFGPI